MKPEFGPRRSEIHYFKETSVRGVAAEAHRPLEVFDLIYRSLCAMLYNYAPLSGHPGGSISSGRIAQTLAFHTMDYDLSDPDRHDADILSYSAGHKALGLYALWALRNEIARVAAPELLPDDEQLQLRLEDLLGFRKNPTTRTPLFRRFHAKPLDGHPTPATPFVRLATGASGVGVGSSLGMAMAAADYYGDDAPKVHIIEGEGGLTPGRTYEALAFAGTASLGNAIMHLDWNQASIDSNHVTRDGEVPGEYVQWDPAELFYLHDWNVIRVDNGMDFDQIALAQEKALGLTNGQPTAIIYRTVKGWRYGIEGRASHGAGHKLCSAGFYDALEPLVTRFGGQLPACEPGTQRCVGGVERETIESCFWEALQIIRGSIEQNAELLSPLGEALSHSRMRLNTRARSRRSGAPSVERVYDAAADPIVPEELSIAPQARITLREQLGKTLGYLNRVSNGAMLIAAADLLASTSVVEAARRFPEGFYNRLSNHSSRILATGGICEDAMSAILSGISSFGRQIGVGSSYGAFVAPLGHIAARLHAIGQHAQSAVGNRPYEPMILICGHAGLKTGEDGPTHADPQPLQLLQENFPPGSLITLTPWDAREIWPLLCAALEQRPAVIVPFVTRPAESVLDRTMLDLAPPHQAAHGLYLLKEAKGSGDGTVVLQESGVTYSFLEGALPLLEEVGVDLNVYYVASAELFDTLSTQERERIFPQERAAEAMGITGFTLPTLYRWIRSDFGRSMSLHPFQKGHFPGSGSAHSVLEEAGLDGPSQFAAVLRYVEERRRRKVHTDRRMPPASQAGVRPTL